MEQDLENDKCYMCEGRLLGYYRALVGRPAGGGIVPLCSKECVTKLKNSLQLRPADTLCMCGVCNRIVLKSQGGMKKCSGCTLNIRYCSKECQIKDWSDHREMCKKYKKEKRAQK